MKSPLINGKLPNGKWRWKGWLSHEWALVIGDEVILDNGMEMKNASWMDDTETGWTKIESIVEIYYKKI